MKKLKNLFAKGFDKLTKGRKVAVLKSDEIIITNDELKSFLIDFYNKGLEKANERIQELENMRGNLYLSGYEAGLKRSDRRALILPADIREEHKHLVDVVGSIATELLEQGDSESCAWLLKKIVKCRSL